MVNICVTEIDYLVWGCVYADACASVALNGSRLKFPFVDKAIGVFVTALKRCELNFSKPNGKFYNFINLYGKWYYIKLWRPCMKLYCCTFNAYTRTVNRYSCVWMCPLREGEWKLVWNTIFWKLCPVNVCVTFLTYLPISVDYDIINKKHIFVYIQYSGNQISISWFSIFAKHEKNLLAVR